MHIRQAQSDLSKIDRLRINRGGQQARSTIAQNICQWIVNLAWLNQAEHVSIVHGVSLLSRNWRALTSQDTPPLAIHIVTKFCGLLILQCLAL